MKKNMSLFSDSMSCSGGSIYLGKPFMEEVFLG